MDQPAATPPVPAFPSPHHISPLGGLLSYLVPGLGQIVQGRVGKGLLFFGCVYFLFFYGMYLGAAEVKVGPRTYRVASNVFLPRAEPPGSVTYSTVLTDLYNRPQFLGQFWVGAAAWPAIVQFRDMNRKEDDGAEALLDQLYEDAASPNLDAQEQEAKRREAAEVEKKRRHPLFGEYMREPGPRAINAVHNGSDKRLELAWVFTVIAGVLNIMVIYDALAGPAFPTPGAEAKKES